MVPGKIIGSKYVQNKQDQPVGSSDDENYSQTTKDHFSNSSQKDLTRLIHQQVCFQF